MTMRVRLALQVATILLTAALLSAAARGQQVSAQGAVLTVFHGSILADGRPVMAFNDNLPRLGVLLAGACDLWPATAPSRSAIVAGSVEGAPGANLRRSCILSWGATSKGGAAWLTLAFFEQTGSEVKPLASYRFNRAQIPALRAFARKLFTNSSHEH
jgi:hypothetical protein